MKSKILFIVFILAGMTSCDPARTLVIKVADQPNLSVSIFGNNAILPYYEGSETKKVIIQIPPEANNQKRDTMFRYGMGGWKIEGVLPEFVKNIDSIVIVKSTGKTVIKNKKELTSYLRANQSGYLGSLLTIEAE